MRKFYTPPKDLGYPGEVIWVGKEDTGYGTVYVMATRVGWVATTGRDLTYQQAVIKIERAEAQYDAVVFNPARKPELHLVEA